jgi:hypothetical protein
MLNPKNLVHQEKQLVKNTEHVDFDQNSIKKSWGFCVPPSDAPPPDCLVAPKINSRLLSFLVPVWRRALKTRRANNHKHVDLVLDGY